MGAENYIRFVAALGLVLALIAIFGLLLRRYGPNAGLPMRRRGSTRRLGVVEVLPLDARRRLVLVKRDGVEHLLLLGMGEDRVVETGITPPDHAQEAGTTSPPATSTPMLGFKALLARQQGTDRPAS